MPDPITVKRPYPRTAPCCVVCRGDGNQVCCLIGTNLAEGVAGFGDDLPSALRDLANGLEREVGEEHEPLATSRWVISTECLLDESGKEVASAANDGSWAVYGSHGSLLSEQSELGTEDCNTLSDAKAAVEKAVRP